MSQIRKATVVRRARSQILAKKVVTGSSYSFPVSHSADQGTKRIESGVGSTKEVSVRVHLIMGDIIGFGMDHTRAEHPST